MLLDSGRLSAQADEFRSALKAGELALASRHARRMSPGRMADMLMELPVETALAFLGQQGWHRGAPVLEAMPLEYAARLLDRLAQVSEDDAGSLFAELDPGAAQRILPLLPGELVELLLSQLDPDYRQAVESLSAYPKDTAGGRMSPYYLAVRRGSSVARTRQAVRDAPAGMERSAYVFVLDEQDRLIGVISLRELMIGNADERVENSMSPDVFAVRDSDSALEAARRIRSRGLKLLPVVNGEDQLVGVISMQKAVDIISEEVADDFVGLGAASPDESFFTPPRRAIARRLPWMASNVFLNLGAVAVIASFEDLIVQVAILAAFLPMITDMGGNVGIQALSVSIRSMALGEARLRDVWKAMRKEIYIGLFNGCCLGILFGLIVLFMQQNPMLAVVAGVALSANVLVAGVVGGTIPFLIKRLGRDPAMMTGPVLTTITDITGVSIYLGLSTLFLAGLMMAH